MNNLSVLRTAVLAIIVLASASIAQAAEIVPYNGPNGNRPTMATGPDLARTGSALRKLMGEFQANRATAPAPPFIASDRSLLVSNGHVLVNAVAASTGAALESDLRGLGLRDHARYGRMVSGYLPIGQIARAAALGSLGSLQAAREPLALQVNYGEVVGQAIPALRADEVHAVGILGTGTVVGILSDSFDADSDAPRSMAQDIATGDLPDAADINILLDGNSFCGANCIDEGRGMAQLVHDVAPGAAIAFHTAWNGQAGFAAGIEALAALNPAPDVIVDDIIYYDEPWFQDGVIAQAADAAKAQGIPYFSSAANSALEAYDCRFIASGEPFSGSAGDGSLHNFAVNCDTGAPTGPSDYGMAIEVPLGTIVTIAMQWKDPYRSACPEGTVGCAEASIDLDAYLVGSHAILGSPVGAATAVDNNTGPTGTGDPVEVLSFANIDFWFDETFEIWIVARGPTDLGAGTTLTDVNGNPLEFKMIVYRGNTPSEHFPGAPTIVGHMNAEGAEAVGAAYHLNSPYNGVDPALLESFSSWGVTPVLFNYDGSSKPEAEWYRLKPGITAVDGTDTTFFPGFVGDSDGDGFVDSDVDQNGYPNFFGTSASAPHAAAVAALMLEANASLLPDDVYSLLRSTARDMCDSDPATHDWCPSSGYGLIDAWEAVQAASGGTINAPPTTTDDSYNGLEDQQIAVAAPGVLGNDSDPEGSAITAVLGSGPAAGSLLLNADGSFTYDPNPDWNGIDSFTYRARDTEGRDSILTTVTLDIAAVNDPPASLDDSYQTQEETPLNVAAPGVLDNDSDPEGDPLQAQLVAGTTFGSLALNPDGSFTYTPGVNFSGDDSFTYQADDGLLQSPTATVTITVTPTNDAPVAVNDAYNVPQDGVLNVAAPGVLDNDSDPDGDGLTAELIAATGPDNGLLTLNPDGSFDYTPDPGFNGDDGFSYRALDGNGGAAPAQVLITVDPAPTSPTTHISDIDGSISNSGKNWNAVAVVRVHDGDEQPVIGATVFFTWSGGASGNGNCQSPCLNVVSPPIPKKEGSTILTVTGVDFADWTYQSGANHDPDSDSGGTAIQINKDGTTGDPGTPPNQPPVASFTFDCTDLDCSFDAAGSSDGDGSIAGYQWDFGDGSPLGSGVAPNHSYADYGTYAVVLTVTDDDGDSGQDNQNVTLQDPAGEPLVANSFTVCVDSGNNPATIDWYANSTGPADRKVADATHSSSKGFTTWDATTITYTATRLKGGDSFGYTISTADGAVTDSATVSISFPKNGC